RSATAVKERPKCFLNYTEAAAMFEVDAAVIRGMVVQGILSAPPEYRSGPSKLVPAAEIQRFAEQYVSTTVLVRRFNVNGSSLARYLKESGTPRLTVPLPTKRREYAFFVLRDAVAGLALAEITPKTVPAQMPLLWEGKA